MNRRFLDIFIPFLLCLSTPAAWAQISLVSATPCPNDAPYPAVTCNIPSSGTGRLIVVGWASSLGVNPLPVIGSVTDNVGNVYVQAGNARSVNNTAGRMADIWYAKNSKPGATTIVVTPNPAGSSGTAVVWQFANVDTTSPLGQTATLNTGATTTSPTGAPITTTTPGELIVSILIPGSLNYGLAAGNPFTNNQSQAGVGWASLVAANPGTYSTRYTTDPGTYASSSVSFRAAGSTPPTTPSNACDLAAPSGVIDVADVNAAINMSLGAATCTANIAGPGVCNVAVVQRVVNAMPPPSGTGTCVTGTGAIPHSVDLSWNPSATPNVRYNLYRGTTSGNYTLLKSSISGTSDTDTTVVGGQTYYYITRAVDINNNLSAPSNEVVAVVPN